MSGQRFSHIFRIGMVVLLTAFGIGPSLVRADEVAASPGFNLANKTVELAFRDVHESFFTLPELRRATYRIEDINIEGASKRYVTLRLTYLSGLEDAPAEVRRRWAATSTSLSVDDDKPDSRAGLLHLFTRKEPLHLHISADERSNALDSDHVERITADFLGRKNVPLTELMKSENDFLDMRVAIAKRNAAAEKKAQELAAQEKKKKNAEIFPAPKEVHFLGLVLVEAPPRPRPRFNSDFPGLLKDMFFSAFYPRKPEKKESRNLVVFSTPIIMDTNSDSRTVLVNNERVKLLEGMDAELLGTGTNSPPREIGTATIAK